MPSLPHRSSRTGASTWWTAPAWPSVWTRRRSASFGKLKHAAARQTAATSRHRPSRVATCTSAPRPARTMSWSGKAERSETSCAGAIRSLVRPSSGQTGSMSPPSALESTPSSPTAPSAGRGTSSKNNWDSQGIVGAEKTGSSTKASGWTSTTSFAVRGTSPWMERHWLCLQARRCCGWKTSATIRSFVPCTGGERTSRSGSLPWG